MLRKYIFFFLFHAACILNGQQNKADSLLKVIETSAKKNKPALYNKLASLYRQGDPGKNIEYATQALQLAKKTGDLKEQGYALSNLSYGWFAKGNYDKTAGLVAQAIEVGKEISDDKLLGACYNILGLVDQNTGNINKSLDNFLMALQYREACKDSNGMAATNNNFGEAYRMCGRFTKALERLHQSEVLYKKLGNKNGLGSAYSNIGAVYFQANNYNSAVYHFELALKLRKETGNKRGLAIVLANIAEVSIRMNNYKKALVMIKESLEITKGMGDRLLYVTGLTTLAETYRVMDSLVIAQMIIAPAIDSARKFGFRPQLLQAELEYGKILHLADKNKEAFEHVSKALEIKDSIFSDESNEKISTLQNEIDKQKRDTEAKLKEENDKRQKTVLMLGVFMLILVAIFLFSRYRIKHRANLQLEDQNKVIAQKNKEISDSIHYARKIQRAMLPLTKDLERIFPKGFGIYLPKDVVSGDFYWFAENHNRFFIAAADCTGHGVPGAFMSMLGSDKLTQVVKNSSLVSPGEILTQLNNSIKHTLKQNEIDSELRDGMDIALCSFDLKNNLLEFAGANRPLLHIRDKNLTQYAPTKTPIGGLTGDDFQYDTHKIELKKGDTIYVFTDGFSDQFGGEKGKKFSSKRLKELLLSLDHKEMKELERELLRVLDNWMHFNNRKFEQVDDILLIGIRI